LNNNSNSNSNGSNIKYTGAKLPRESLVDSIHSSVLLFPSQNLNWIRESGEQLRGQLRLKSGRSDIKAENRTKSKSCTDKICKWIYLGIQG
jgi:hypothetical protein